jgi:hypothetical protein
VFVSVKGRSLIIINFDHLILLVINICIEDGVKKEDWKGIHNINIPNLCFTIDITTLT